MFMAIIEKSLNFIKHYLYECMLVFLGEDLPMFPVDQEYLSEVRYRVGLVRQIETTEYR